jgi:hypothetical protein
VTSPVRLTAAPELPTAAEAELPGLCRRPSGCWRQREHRSRSLSRLRKRHARPWRNGPTSRRCRVGFRTHDRFKPREVPTLPRRRRRSLGTGCQSARIEDRLSAGGHNHSVCRATHLGSHHLTDPRQFWRGTNAIRSNETPRVHHPSRRRGSRLAARGAHFANLGPARPGSRLRLLAESAQ